MIINKKYIWDNPYHQDRKLYHKISKLIIHHSGTNNEWVISVWRWSRYEVSFHFSIQKDWEIIQYLEEDQIWYHCWGGEKYFEYIDNKWWVNNLNPISIGIEIVNYWDNIDKYTDAQRKSLIELTQYIVNKYNIKSEDIIWHKELTKNKIDPTPSFFEWGMDWFRKYIKETYVNKYDSLWKVKIFNKFNNESVSNWEIKELIEVWLFRLIENLKKWKLVIRNKKTKGRK